MSGVYPAGVEVRRQASISANGQYRWSLHRDWRTTEERPRWATFVMLNPSTADGEQDDPTIRRCVGFARALGCTGLAVVNLYAFRATSPADLWKTQDPVGPTNDHHLAVFLSMSKHYGFPVIAAWGAHARPDRIAQVVALPGADRLTCLGMTKSGAPRHPLYLPATAELVPWPTGGAAPTTTEES